jgi:hypothetical protein
MVLSAMLALLAALLLVQPASAQEEDPCASPTTRGDRRHRRQ